MANEFVARRGLIAQSGGAQITGSLLVSGSINATGYNIIGTSFTGSFSGSIGTATTASYVQPSGLPIGTVSASSQIDYNSIQNKLSGVVSSSAQVQPLLPGGTVSSSAQYPGWVTASSQIVWSQVNYNTGIVSASAQVQPLLPAGTISASSQFNSLTSPFSGSFTGSFRGDGSNLTGLATTLNITGSTSGQSSINLLTQGLIVSGGNGMTATVTGNTVTVAAPAGNISSSNQVDYNSIQNKLSGVYSSSAFSSPSQGTARLTLNNVALADVDLGLQTGDSPSFTGLTVTTTSSIAAVYSSSAQVTTAITNRTIAPSVINATGAISGASIQTSGNGTIGGNLTVNGLLTAVSTSFQYVTSSQLNVADNKITVNTNDLLRFGGLSIIDSGSTSPVTASIFWDSLAHRFIYENLSGSAYNSAIFIAGPTNVGTTGNEVGLSNERIPVGFLGDHIDNRPESSSIRVIFPSRLTHIEAGLFVTGNLTANGTVTLQGIPSSAAQIVPLLPPGTISSSIQIPGVVTGSLFTGSFTGSVVGVFTGSVLANNGVISSSTQVAASLPGGTVSSSLQYPGWVTASSQIQLASITGTTFASSNFTFPQQLTVSGVLSASTSAFINNRLYSGSNVTGIVGPVSNQIVASFITGSFKSAHFDYVINDGTNYRTGTVMSVWSPGSVEFTEISTADLGNTTQATFTVDILAGVARLRFSNISGTWTVKTAVRAL